VTGRLRRDLGLVPLTAIVFFNVSGGPYGIEDSVSVFGPGLALLLLVVTPLVWSLPVALAMSELASAMPDEGGYVTWVDRAFGRFWAFQVGWWSWIDSFVDVAVYPALFVEYARYWIPALSGLGRWLVALAFIVLLTWLNVIGVRPVGRAAVALGIAALVPVGGLVAAGLTSVRTAPWTPFRADDGSLTASLGLGLAVMMWNYSGWDTPSTCLGETRAPERAFRLALLAALPLIAVAYLLPLGAALASGRSDWARWETGALPAIAGAIGGPWLGHLVAAGAVLSTAGLFMSLTLTNSRLPYVLGRDGLMPRIFTAVHPGFGTPWVAVVVSAACYAAFAAFSFRDLIVLNIWLYCLSLLLELAAFAWLRKAQPGLERPWRVPGGVAGAAAVVILPALCCAVAMATADLTDTVAGAVAALTGPVAYVLLRRPSGGRGGPVTSEKDVGVRHLEFERPGRP
jgi:amino acid transporter